MNTDIPVKILFLAADPSDASRLRLGQELRDIKERLQIAKRKLTQLLLVSGISMKKNFFKRGRYYFDGVWNQAAQGAEGQQAILRVLAPHPQGLSYEDVMGEVSKEGLDEESLQEAINTLQRHDVIEETQGQWRIIVELFRRWLIQQI